MKLKDLLKSIKKEVNLDYWLHVFRGEVFIGTIYFNHEENYITLNSIEDSVIDVVNAEVKITTFKLLEEYEFVITIK